MPTSPGNFGSLEQLFWFKFGPQSCGLFLDFRENGGLRNLSRVLRVVSLYLVKL